ncbi:MAG TPA: S53 family peptidase [Candidatus Dormibacteraeota bacterium]|nr:S53 family peptidase [Candidatus Dormibacteraeota bacterium]
MVNRVTRVVCAAVLTAALVVSGAAGLRAAMLDLGSAPATAVLPQLTDNVLPGLDRLAPLGLPSPLTEMRIGIGLEPADRAGELALYEQLYDPASPRYHQFLTPDEVAAHFGVPPSRYRAVESWLQGGGLRISHLDSARTYLQATGTAAQIDRLFATTLHTYRAGGVDFIANSTRPAVPAGLGIVSVIGLNTLQRFSIPQRVQPSPGVGGLYTDSYTPQALWSLYDQPADNLGQGQTMAIIGAGSTDAVIGDLRRFEDINHLPHAPVTVKHAGAGSFKDNSGLVEWDLDTQSSTGMAPLVKREDLYFGATLSDADVLSAFSLWASDHDGPRQADASFGECETNPLNPVTGNPAANPNVPFGQGLGNNLEPVAEQTLLQLTLEGRSLFASSGDTGSSCPIVVLPIVGAGNGVANQGLPLQGYPAASKYAVAVGGTVLYASAGTSPTRRAVEYAWTFTGGGSSLFIDRPDYQKGVMAIRQPCVVDPAGKPYPPGTLCRGLPDVAAISGDLAGNGYTIVNNMKISPGGGTSLSSPLWVGMWTRIQAAAADQTHGLGFANQTLYRVGTGPRYAEDFHDITLGGNGLYTATPGWDYVSGFGTPNVTNLMRDIDGRTAPVINTLPPAPAAPPLASPCDSVWTSPAGNANDPLTTEAIPQADLIRGDLGLSPDGKSVRVGLTVSRLDGSMPAEAMALGWTMFWTYNGVTYFGHARLDRLGAVTFADGISDAKGSADAHTDDTGGLVKGSPGRIQIDVPLSHVGSPPPGARLTYPLGDATEEIGILPAGVDTGGTQRDALLVPCGSAPPNPPAAQPPPLPVGVGHLSGPPLAPAPGSAPPAPAAPPLLPPLQLPRAAVGVRSLLGGLVAVTG